MDRSPRCPHRGPALNAVSSRTHCTLRLGSETEITFIELHRLRVPLWQLGLVAVAVVAIVVVFLPLTPAYDLQVLLQAGRAAPDGLAVYPSPSSPAVYSGASFVYPYLTVWPFVPLAALPIWLATAVFFVIVLGAILTASVLGSERDPVIAVLVLATSFTLTGLQLGTLSPLLLAGAVFLWRLRDHPVAFGLLAGPVVASKLFLVPLLAWPLLARRHRAFAWASACTTVLIAGGFALGPLGPSAYARLLSVLGAHEAKSGFGVTGAFMTAGLGPAVSEAAAGIFAAAVLVAVYLRFRQTHEEAVLFCGAVVASLIATPVLWSHYLALLAAALLAAAAPRRWFLLLALASWVIAPPHGITIHVQPSQSVASHGAWLALATSLAVIAYAMRQGHRFSQQHPPDR